MNLYPVLVGTVKELVSDNVTLAADVLVNVDCPEGTVSPPFAWYTMYKPYVADE